VELRANRNVRTKTPRPTKADKTTGSRPTGQNPTKIKQIVSSGIEPDRRYSPADIPRLREHWFKEYSDLLGPIPLELPPFREVNHHIPLIDENLRYNYHLPRCPEALEQAIYNGRVVGDESSILGITPSLCSKEEWQTSDCSRCKETE
jgi:hypothetical protein